MEIGIKLRHYIPFDGAVRLRSERWGRAARRWARYQHLRRARYPWNAATHLLRWNLSPAERIDDWVNDRLQVASKFWLFIAGCNNSGTTLMREILRTHSGIRALPREGQLLTRALPRPTAVGLPRLFTKRMDLFRWTEEDDPTPALRAKYDWSRYVDRRRGIILEKSPEDIVRTRWLQKNFAPARFIAIVRSPYAVCEGTRRRSGHSIEESAHHWATANACLLDDLPHLDRNLFLRYEDFCAAPTEHLERIQTFLGLDTAFSASAIECREVHNIDKQASGVQNFNAKSLRRLSQQDIATINHIAGPVMDRLGYELVGRAETSAAAVK